MAKVEGVTKKGFRRAIAGSHLIRRTIFGAVAQTWPRKRGSATEGYDLYRQAEFGLAAKLAANPTALDRMAAENLAKHFGMVWRDVLTRAAMGTLLHLTTLDGRKIEPARMVTQNPLYWLDLLSDVPGAIVYRAAIGWVGLLPDGANKVLRMGPDNITPRWAVGTGEVDSVFGRNGIVVAAVHDYSAVMIDYDNSTSGLSAIDVQAACDELAAQIASIVLPDAGDLTTWLDTYGSTRGTIITRGASAWHALAPGGAGQFLEMDSSGHEPVWSTTPGAGGSSNACIQRAATTASDNTATALMGDAFVVRGDMHISAVYADLPNTPTMRFAGFAAKCTHSGSTYTVAAVQISTNQNNEAAGDRILMRFPLSSPVVVGAGDYLVLGVIRNDGANTLSPGLQSATQPGFSMAAPCTHRERVRKTALTLAVSDTLTSLSANTGTLGCDWTPTA